MIAPIHIDSKFRNYFENIRNPLLFDIVNNQNSITYGKIYSNRDLSQVCCIVNCGFLTIPNTSTIRLTNVIGLSINNYNNSAFMLPTINNIHFYFKVVTTSNHIMNCESYKYNSTNSDRIVFDNPISIHSFNIKFYENTNQLVFPEDFLECAIDFDDVYSDKTKLTVISGSPLVGGHGINGHGMEDDETYCISFVNFKSNTPGYMSSENKSDYVYKNNIYRVDYINSTSFYVLGIVLPNNNSSRNVIIFIENHRIVFNMLCELDSDKKEVKDLNYYQNNAITKMSTYK